MKSKRRARVRISERAQFEFYLTATENEKAEFYEPRVAMVRFGENENALTLAAQAGSTPGA